MPQANERLPLRILGYVLLPNHFHLVLWPRRDGDLSRWMQWLLTSHVRRYHRHYHGSGHVWQGRFKAFPIEQDEHLLAVLRYVERNPLRANLVRAGRGLGVVQFILARRTQTPAVAFGLASVLSQKMAGACQRASERAGAGGAATELGPRRSVRQRALDLANRQAARPGIIVAPTRPTQENKKVECPLLLSQGCRPRTLAANVTAGL